MAKITFMGAGSSVFAKNVLGDCMCSEVLRDSDIRLYDIDEDRLEDSYLMLTALNKNINENRATINKYLGVEQRKEALRGAEFVVNAIQVGGYQPCTVTDFEIPRKYGLRQTIADTLGIGGIMRGLRTIPVLKGFAEDMEEVCPEAWFLNYTNPMAILTGYMQKHTSIKTIGLCHSVQTCTSTLFEGLDMASEMEGRREVIAGINHMAWLLSVKNQEGIDLYPEIKQRAAQKNANEKHEDMVRYDYIDKLGYYCTESSEHNAEYNPYYIKSKYPELIDKFNIPLDEYPRRCERHVEEWADQRRAIMNDGQISHERSNEYASYIMEALVTGIPYQIGGNVINNGLISNLPKDAVVEVPCLINGSGIHPTYIGDLPTQLMAMNMSNISPQLLAIEAAVTGDRQKIYQAAMMDPHTGAELSIEAIIKMCDELIEAHGDYMSMYR